MNDFKLNKDKTIAALLYICNELGGAWDLYSLLKILYFAEQKHLVRYGRPITGDDIIALPHGPVNSWAYDLLKPAKLDPNYFEVLENDVISCKQKPDLDELSQSDIKCLQESIKENKDLGFGQLKRKSHDQSYEYTIKNIGRNSKIPFIEIAKAAGANEELIKYILVNMENEYLSLK